MPNPILDLAAQFRMQALQRERVAATQLVRAYGQVYRNLDPQIRALEEALRGLENPRPVDIQRLASLRVLKEQTIEQVNRYAAYADTTIAGEVQANIAVGLRDSEALVQAHFDPAWLQENGLVLNTDVQRAIRASWVRVPSEAVETMVGMTQPDSPLRQALVHNLGDVVAQQMVDALVTGIATGKNPRVIAREAMGAGLNYSLTTARTAQLWAYREASRANYQANRDIVSGWKWSASLDSRTCPSCLSLHGSLHAADETLNGHHNCVVGGTKVSSPNVLATSKRWFDGDVIEIRTVNGNVLTVTKNHPILTDKGWVAAHLLSVGDKVVSSRNPERAISVIDPNDNDRPTLIEDVLESFAGTLGVRSVTMPTTAKDFHGDGIKGDVNVVTTDGFLLRGGDSAVNQPTAQHTLSIADMRSVPFTSNRNLAPVSERTSATTNRVLGNLDSAQMFILGSLRSKQTIGLRIGAPMDSRRHNVARNDVSGYSVELGNHVLGFTAHIAPNDVIDRQVDSYGRISANLGVANGVASGLITKQSPRPEFIDQSLFGGVELMRSVLGALPGNIELDCILEVTVRAFSGHVYNLQTSTGWYFAEGIITHNCRCAMIPVIPLAAKLGIPEPDMGDAETWLKAQPESVQQEMLGKGVYEGYKSGKWGLKDLSTTYEDGVYGTMRRPPTLESLQALYA